MSPDDNGKDGHDDDELNQREASLGLGSSARAARRLRIACRAERGDGERDRVTSSGIFRSADADLRTRCATMPAHRASMKRRSLAVSPKGPTSHNRPPTHTQRLPGEVREIESELVIQVESATQSGSRQLGSLF